MRVTAAALIIASTCVCAQAQDNSVEPFQAEGVVTSTSRLREAPPHGPFNLFVGKSTETITEGSQVEILDKKTYSGFSGTHVWYKIRPTEQQRNELTTPAWIYGGVEGKDSQVELEKIK